MDYNDSGDDCKLHHPGNIAEQIQEEADPDANIIFGATVSEDMEDRVSVTIIATDFSTSGVDPIASEMEAIKVPAMKGKPVELEGGLSGVEMDLHSILENDTEDKHSTLNFDVPDFLR